MEEALTCLALLSEIPLVIILLSSHERLMIQLVFLVGGIKELKYLSLDRFPVLNVVIYSLLSSFYVIKLILQTDYQV